jgi:hypothetical protein
MDVFYCYFVYAETVSFFLGKTVICTCLLPFYKSLVKLAIVNLGCVLIMHVNLIDQER